MSDFSGVIQVVATVVQLALGAFGVSEGVSFEPLTINAGYRCEQPVWVKRPQLKSGAIYLASMSSECRVYPQLGGDLEKLQAFSIEKLKQYATIERGPIDSTFEGLPSKYLDVTAFVKGKDSVTIQQDVQIATDQVSRLLSSSVSRKIVGTGNGVYLKKINTRAEVTKTTMPTEDKVVVTFYTEVEKPWFAPEGVFLSEAEKRVPGEFVKLRNQVVGEMSKNY